MAETCAQQLPVLGGADMHLAITVLRLVFTVVVALGEALCWIGLGAVQLVLLTLDAVRAHRQLSGGGLHCDEGHSVSAAGSWECSACQFRWQGLVWQCPNPSCHALTPFVACPVCRRSVRNPYLLEGHHVRPTS